MAAVIRCTCARCKGALFDDAAEYLEGHRARRVILNQHVEIVEEDWPQLFLPFGEGETLSHPSGTVTP